MNENMIKGKWLEIKGEIQKAWGKLTADELDKTEGDAKAIAGLIQQRYGEKQDDNADRLSKIFKKFGDAKDGIVDETKTTLKN